MRCLLMAMRVISDAEYKAFDNAYNNLPDDNTRATKLGKLR